MNLRMALGSAALQGAPKEDDTPKEDETPKEEDASGRDGHLLYALEILLFALVGWGWVAVRELMGGTPVLDVSVLLSVLVCSVMNLVLALVYPTQAQFKGAAKALLNLALCLLLLYSLSLAQSTANDASPICCEGGGNTFSLRLTFRAAYFGGLALHQPPAAITLAYLCVFLVLTAAQARSCAPKPRDWLLGQLPLVLACHLGLQPAMFVLKAPLCQGKEAAGFLVALIVGGWLALLTETWVKRLAAKKAPTDTARLVQVFLELFLIILFTTVTAVLAVGLGGGESLVVVLCAAVLWQAWRVRVCVYELMGEQTKLKLERVKKV